MLPILLALLATVVPSDSESSGAFATGRAVDADGDPIAGLKLELADFDPPEQWDERPSVLTDADGRFRFELGRLDSDTRILFGSLGDGTSLLTSGAIYWQDDVGDLFFERIEPWIRGRVVDEAGTPVADARVVTWNKACRVFAETNSEGRFAIGGIFDKDVWLDARSKDGKFVAASFQPAVDGSGTPRDVTLSLVKAGVLAGTVTDECGETVGGAEIRLLDGSDELDWRVPKWKLLTDDQGRFECRSVPPASRWSVSANGLEAALLESITDQATITLRSRIAINARTLRADDDAPVLVDRVEFVGDNRPWWVRFVAKSDGGCRISVRPPETRMGDEEPNHVDLVAYVQGLAPARFRVSAKQEQSPGDIALRFETGSAVDVAVTDPEGLPIADARVTVEWDGRSENPSAHPDIWISLAPVLTGADGVAHITGIPNGEIRIGVGAAGFPNAKLLTNTTQSTTPVAIRLERGSFITGFVTESGRKLDGFDGYRKPGRVETGSQNSGVHAGFLDRSGRFRVGPLPAGDYFIGYYDVGMSFIEVYADGRRLAAVDQNFSRFLPLKEGESVELELRIRNRLSR